MIEVSDQVDYVTALITKFVSSTPKYAQKQFSSMHFFPWQKCLQCYYPYFNR